MGIVLIAALYCCLLHGGKAAAGGSHHYWNAAAVCFHPGICADLAVLAWLMEGWWDDVGRQIMDLWDHLCTILRVRTVSVEDVSNKVWDLNLPTLKAAG